MRIWCTLLALAVLAAGCKKDPEPTPTAASGSAVTPAAPDTVEIFVDNTSVAKITKDQIAKWPTLDSLVPPRSRRLGTWQAVHLESATKTEVVHKPSSSYPDMVPAVFPGSDGIAAFGMFDRVELAKHGQPGLRQDGVREIRIETSKEGRGGDHQGNVGAVDDPMKLVLAIKTPDGDKTLTGEKIMAIPREPMPGNETNKGWPLSKLLEAAGVTKYTKLVLVDAAGTSLTIEHAEFDDKTVIPFIKLNRQGSLRFRMLKQQGEGWQFAGDLRALATIKVD